MHILLPPSEGKTPGGRGRPLTPDDSPLGRARCTVLAGLHALVTGDPAEAAEALLLPRGVAADALAANAAVAGSRTMPALRRYAGVVYDGLAYADLSPAAQRLAGRSLHIFSGLLGVVRGDEPVPYYRLPAKATLPGIGVAGAYWRPLLAEVLRERLADGLILDLRSSDYAAMWRPDKATTERVVTVRILSKRPSGSYAVVSYNSKFAKGRLAAALLEAATSGLVIDSLDKILQTCARIGIRGETPTPRHVDLYTA